MNRTLLVGLVCAPSVLVAACSRGDRHGAKSTPDGPGATTVTAAHVAVVPLRAYDALARDADGAELFHADVEADGTATFRTTPLIRDACVHVVASVSGHGMSVTADGPGLSVSAPPGETLFMPAALCIRAGESLTLVVHGTGTARIIGVTR